MGSPGRDVSPTWPTPTTTIHPRRETYVPLQRRWAWYNQERYKGTKNLIQNAVGFGRNEGGWAFNDAYKKLVFEYDETTHGTIERLQVRTPEEVEAANYSDDRLKSATFFGPFEDTAICTTNLIGEISYAYRAQLLADAIPAESLAAGFTTVPTWRTRNHNMSEEFKDGNMKVVLTNQKWVHSF